MPVTLVRPERPFDSPPTVLLGEPEAGDHGPSPPGGRRPLPPGHRDVPIGSPTPAPRPPSRPGGPPGGESNLGHALSPTSVPRVPSPEPPGRDSKPGGSPPATPPPGRPPPSGGGLPPSEPPLGQRGSGPARELPPVEVPPEAGPVVVKRRTPTPTVVVPDTPIGGEPRPPETLNPGGRVTPPEPSPWGWLLGAGPAGGDRQGSQDQDPNGGEGPSPSGWPSRPRSPSGQQQDDRPTYVPSSPTGGWSIGVRRQGSVGEDGRGMLTPVSPTGTMRIGVRREEKVEVDGRDMLMPVSPLGTMSIGVRREQKLEVDGRAMLGPAEFKAQAGGKFSQTSRFADPKPPESPPPPRPNYLRAGRVKSPVP
jgi:hypothetical protein